ncbi:MAG: hypothetical protein ABI778_07875, partial [Ignavibacteriota bacterium]
MREPVKAFGYRKFTAMLVIAFGSILLNSKATSQIVDTQECEALIKFASTRAWPAQAAYDAYKTYIEHCALLPNSWAVFIDVGGMNAKRNDDLHRHEEYREWLKKVLYHNLDTTYYCADVNQILHTLSWFNDQRGNDDKGTLAILYFLVQTNRCPKATAYYDTVGIPAEWNDVYDKWGDTVVNPILSPFDSTLPSLDDLDLGILRGKPADVKKYFDSKYGAVFSNLITLDNPFSSET